jgi:hypothetical protein
MIYVYILCKNNIFVHFVFRSLLDVKVIITSLSLTDENMSILGRKT